MKLKNVISLLKVLLAFLLGLSGLNTFAVEHLRIDASIYSSIVNGLVSVLENSRVEDWNDYQVEHRIACAPIGRGSTMHKQYPIEVWAAAAAKKPARAELLALLEWFMDKGVKLNFRDADSDVNTLNEFDSRLALPYLIAIFHRQPLSIKGEPGEVIKLDAFKPLVDGAARMIEYYAGGLDAATLPLHAALLKGDAAAFDKALNEGADVDRCDAIGNQPIHLAMYMMDDVAIDKLLAAGASVMGMSDQGETLLHMAITRGALAYIIPELEKRGLSPWVRDESFKALPIHYCDWDELCLPEVLHTMRPRPCMPKMSWAACKRWAQMEGLIDAEGMLSMHASDLLFNAADVKLSDWGMGLTEDPLYSLCRAFRNGVSELAALIPEGQKAVCVLRNRWDSATVLMIYMRRLQKEHPGLHFYVVEPEMLKQGTGLLERFSGFMVASNQGDMLLLMCEEGVSHGARGVGMLAPVYNGVFSYAAEKQLPILAIEAGYKSMGLWSRAGLLETNDDSDQYEPVSFEPKTLLYWMMLDKAEQKALLERCEMPVITFAVESVSNNSMDAEKLPRGLVAAAKSRLGTVLSVTDNVHQVGVSFSPEMFMIFSNQNPEGVKRQALLFENFIGMVDKAHPVQLQCAGKNCRAEFFKAEVYGESIEAVKRMQVCEQAPIFSAAEDII